MNNDNKQPNYETADMTNVSKMKRINMGVNIKPKLNIVAQKTGAQLGTAIREQFPRTNKISVCFGQMNF